MYTLNCKGRLLKIQQPVVMGIINITPDSFYSGSRRFTVDSALLTAEQMLKDGATMLDIGGQSTRPGSKQLTEEEEMKRVLPVIEALRSRFPESFISVDTYFSSVARAAVETGADIINDISGGSFDASMLATVAGLRVPYICMHVKGTADTMHKTHAGIDITPEVLDYFIAKKQECQEAGIVDLIIDPGFGFSKTIAQNFEILKNLEVFSILHKPLLLGVSRKSSIYKTLGITPEEALNGTTVLHTAGLLKGASILRVHDVKEAVEAVKLTQYLR
ncbi:MAG: dihydropteroate synthase [Bacteroidetes bacterium]|nr:dihydropteroate synthase [Bacteroidota bacterium]